MADSPTPEDRQNAANLAEHLPTGYTAEFDGGQAVSSGDSQSPANGVENESEQSSLRLQGGDMHRDLFKMDARAKMHRRANTFHHDRSASRHNGNGNDDGDEEDVMPVQDQLQPQGFRRAFIRQQARTDFAAARAPVTKTFVEFLDLYGNFMGEYLYDSDDEAIESTEDEGEREEEEPEGPLTETRPLLRARRSTRTRPTPPGTAGVRKTFFTLFKAFVGTGIMFLPKAFNNGGLLFSCITMLVVSAVSMVAFHLLLQCKKHHNGGYGEIGLAIAGPRMRGLILGSVCLSQLGFVCAGIVFAAENLASFFRAVLKHSPFSSTHLILMQLVALIPLSFIRNIAKLGPAALLADVFIAIGIGYIYYYDIGALAQQGIHETVVLFNPEKYTMTIGAAIFTFEGIGLLLPIQSSMAKPHRFEWLLGVVMVLITIVFTSVGALCYATFGEGTQIEIINNFPQDDRLVNAVQFLYSIAVLAGDPVQLFPAVRILEGQIFGHHSGKKSLKTKWIKNAFRTFLVLLCGVVSITGAGNLDRFVALIGSVACVPLVYIYPPYLHYKGVAKSRMAKAGDVALMVLGLVCMIYTTIITVVNSFM